MERVSEILNSVKERLSNPFIFSFLLAWLLYNWEIPVAMFWYNAQTIHSLGYNSLHDLINCKIQQEGSLKYPIIASVIITIALPVLRVVFTTFNAWVTRYGNFLFFEISKKSNISTESYLSLRDSYLESLNRLKKVIEDEKDYELKFRDLESRQISLNENSEVLRKMDDKDFLNGSWEIFYSKLNYTAYFRYFGGNIQFTEQEGNNQTVYPNESLSFFMRDIRATERLMFQIRSSSGPDVRLKTYDLSKIGEGRYEGYENFTKQIIVSKVRSEISAFTKPSS